MSAPSPKSSPCTCGQVVFDLSDRKIGAVLTCSFCGRQFRFADADSLTPLTPEEAKRPTPSPKPSPTQRPRAAAKPPDGPPGGMMPMVVCIIAFNALAFTAIWLLLPKEEDGLRHAVWDHDWTVPGKALWPELSALVLGHILGFACWAAYVYKKHHQEKLDKKP